MKKKELTELKNKSKEQIKKTIAELEKELINQEMEHTVGKVKNVHAIAGIRKSIAQTKTILTLKTLSDQSKEVKNAAS